MRNDILRETRTQYVCRGKTGVKRGTKQGLERMNRGNLRSWLDFPNPAAFRFHATKPPQIYHSRILQNGRFIERFSDTDEFHEFTNHRFHYPKRAFQTLLEEPLIQKLPEEGTH